MKKVTASELADMGFMAVEQKHLELAHPPKIHWGRLYRDQTVEQRLAYAEKLAASMNHAAARIQDERDELARLCDLKERRIKQLESSLAANTAMIQQQMTQWNEDRQKFRTRFAALRKELRDTRRALSVVH